MPILLLIPVIWQLVSRETRTTFLRLGTNLIKVLTGTMWAMTFINILFVEGPKITDLTRVPVRPVPLFLTEDIAMALLLPTLIPVLARLATVPTPPLLGLTITLTTLGLTPKDNSCGVHPDTLAWGPLTAVSTPLKTRKWVGPVRPTVLVTIATGSLATPTLTRRVATLSLAFVIPKLTLFRKLLTFRTLARTWILLFLPTRFTVVLSMGPATGILVLTSDRADL